jgi:hypothetical protein
MSKTKRLVGSASLAINLVMLVACGGGGGGGDSATSGPPTGSGAKAEGAYAGTLTGSASTGFQMLVLENDEYWALYGTSVGGTFGVAGFLQGNGVSSNARLPRPTARISA